MDLVGDFLVGDGGGESKLAAAAGSSLLSLLLLSDFFFFAEDLVKRVGRTIDSVIRDFSGLITTLLTAALRAAAGAICLFSRTRLSSPLHATDFVAAKPKSRIFDCGQGNISLSEASLFLVPPVPLPSSDRARLGPG